jgi:ligand-binding SRPBCC domain-containing protein
MSSHLEFEQWVPFPLERVFAFFSNPENLPRIMPQASATRLIVLNRVPPSGIPPPGASNKAAGVGSTIVTSFRPVPFLPIRKQWAARITEFEWNHFFVDVQDKGPFRRWRHRHEVISETRGAVSGTKVRDELEFEVGFSIVGRIAERVFIRRAMEQTFSNRQQVLPDLLARDAIR